MFVRCVFFGIMGEYTEIALQYLGVIIIVIESHLH